MGLKIRPSTSAEHLSAADGLEGVLEVLDGWFALSVWPGDGHDVESRGILQQMVALEVGQGKTGQAPLFVVMDGLGR